MTVTTLTRPLTANQMDCAHFLNGRVGQTVLVLTSGYRVAPEAEKTAVGYASSAALRGLEARGYIRIDHAFWRGARVTVLRPIV